MLRLSQPYLPIIKAETDKYFPNVPYRQVFAGQFEQESCPKCWDPKSTAKVPDKKNGGYLEIGIGLGQTTITKKYDNVKEWRKLDKSMAGWTDKELYNPVFQIRGAILYDRLMFNSLKYIPDEKERLKFAISSYNKGLGNVIISRKKCVGSCNPNVWFDNVETTCRGSAKVVQQYGRTFCDINIEYVRNIFQRRMDKYEPYLK